MWRIVLVIWTMASAVLAGIFVLVVLATPALSDSPDVLKWIEIAAASGAVAACPVSYLVAKEITKNLAAKKV